MHWLFLLVNHNAIRNFCLNYDLQGASLEVVTEALWAETEALKPEAEARPRRLKILSRRDRGEALEGLEAASRPRRRDRGHIPKLVATFTYRPSLVKIDARSFELSW